MLFTTKLASALLAITASALSAHSAVIARHELSELNVIFYDDVNLVGASFSPDDLVQGVCNTLPAVWLDRAESVTVSPPFSCNFYQIAGCAGPIFATVVSGSDLILNPDVESLLCTKTL